MRARPLKTFSIKDGRAGRYAGVPSTTDRSSWRIGLMGGATWMAWFVKSQGWALAPNLGRLLHRWAAARGTHNGGDSWERGADSAGPGVTRNGSRASPGIDGTQAAHEHEGVRC